MVQVHVQIISMKIIRIANIYDIMLDHGRGSRKVGESGGKDWLDAINNFYKANKSYDRDRLFAQNRNDPEDKLRKEYDFLKSKYDMKKTFEEFVQHRKNEKEKDLKKERIKEQKDRQGSLF
jgi:hypothetical protein